MIDDAQRSCIEVYHQSSLAYHIHSRPRMMADQQYYMHNVQRATGTNALWWVAWNSTTHHRWYNGLLQ